MPSSTDARHSAKRSSESARPSKVNEKGPDLSTATFGHIDQHRWRPYRVECTGSLSTSEVKRHRARLVLGWGTAWELPGVLPAFVISFWLWHTEQTSEADWSCRHG